MNVKRHMGILNPFSIKIFFCDKMGLRLFYFDVAIISVWRIMVREDLF